jgi:uncharacterized membrane protein YfcA
MGERTGLGQGRAARRFPDLQLDHIDRLALPAGGHLWFALLALPATIFGTWLGTRTYHVLSDRNFGDVVLGLLFLSGVGLVWSSLGLP